MNLQFCLAAALITLSIFLPVKSVATFISYFLKIDAISFTLDISPEISATIISVSVLSAGNKLFVSKKFLEYIAHTKAVRLRLVQLQTYQLIRRIYRHQTSNDYWLGSCRKLQRQCRYSNRILSLS
jgi:hypothetical protein